MISVFLPIPPPLFAEYSRFSLCRKTCHWITLKNLSIAKFLRSAANCWRNSREASIGASRWHLSAEKESRKCIAELWSPRRKVEWITPFTLFFFQLDSLLFFIPIICITFVWIFFFKIFWAFINDFYLCVCNRYDGQDEKTIKVVFFSSFLPPKWWGNFSCKIVLLLKKKFFYYFVLYSRQSLFFIMKQSKLILNLMVQKE